MVEVRRLVSVGQGAGARWLPSLALAAVVACSGNPRPPADPPPRTPSSGTEPAEAPVTPPPPTPATPRQPVVDVIIEPADPEADAQPTLAEAARHERERRRQAGEPMVVITDANLEDHAIGQLTFMEDEEEEDAPSDAEPGAADEGPDEQYWRERVRGIRQRWADTAAEVPMLEDRAAELRRRFYETDDAYYRDTRIKPAWDRAIDLIAQARAEAEAHRGELEAALDEGRRAGALPGWLREGIDLEPEPPEPEIDPSEPGEPKIVEPGEGREP